jgi:hypothetical protein
VTTHGPDAETVAAGALDWLLSSALPAGTGLAWAGTTDSGELDPTLYSGGAGIVITLLEAHRHFRDDRYADAALRASRALAAAVDDWDICSLYFGLTGMAFALRAAGRLLGDAAAGRAAGRALDIVRPRFDGERWGAQFELLGGNAGIALGALAAGDPAWPSSRSPPTCARRNRPRAGCTGRSGPGLRRVSTTSRTARWASSWLSPPWARPRAGPT